MARLSIATAAVALSLLTAEASEREMYFSPALETDGPTEYVDTVSANMISCDYHFRVELPSAKGSPAWGVRLVYGDGTERVVRLSRDRSMAAGSDYGSEVTVCVSGSDGAEADRYTVSGQPQAKAEGWSLRLVKRAEDSGLNCVVGQSRVLLEFGLPSDSLREIVAFTDGKPGLSRLSLTSEDSDFGATCRFESEEDLAIYINESRDDFEHMWRYLDRNTDQRHLNTGGDYRLATVRCADGSYEIVYLGGARVNASRWRPMMLKGRLKPTVFDGHFDLEWFDAYGRRLSLEASADITDGTVLKLNLPLHGGTVRYQREAGK